MPLIPLSKKEHSNYSFKELDNFENFKKRNLVPFCIAELTKVVTDYTFVFTKINDNFTICILTGFTTDNNLYINDSGKWLGKYIPAVFRSIPFVFNLDEEKKSKNLCFIDEFKCVIEGENLDSDFSKIFNRDGEFSENFEKKLNFLRTFEFSNDETLKLCKELNDSGLIVEWPIKLKFTDAEKEVTGLFKIDEEKFFNLGDDSINKLLSTKAIFLASGQIFSKNNLEKIGLLHSHIDNKSKVVDENKSFRDQVLEKQRKENTKELDQLVKNLIEDE